MAKRKSNGINRNRQKRSKVEAEGEDAIISSTDRLSALPESLMLQIFLLLPPIDALHISFLSKSWWRLWNSIPTQNFEFKYLSFQRRLRNENLVAKEKADRFLKFIDDSLQKLEDVNNEVKIETFVLHLHSAVHAVTSYDLFSYMKQWMRLVAKKHIKHLDMKSNLRHPCVYLPATTFLAKSLSTLKLQGFALPDSILFNVNLNFPCLQNLSLIRVNAEERVAEKLLSSCPFLQELYMKECRGLDDLLCIPNLPKLTQVNLISNSNTFVAIEASNVQLLIFKVSGYTLPNLNGCKNLKHLRVSANRDISSLWIQQILNKFDQLETLHLKYVPTSTVEISSHHQLKSLSLVHLHEDVHLIKIDAPNLESYKYKNNRSLPLSYPINTPSLQAARLSLDIGAYLDTMWFLRLRNYLFKTFHKHQVLNLRLGSPQITFDPWTRDLQPSKVERVEIEVLNSRMSYSALLNGILWCAHPTALYVKGSKSNIDFIEFLCETLIINMEEIEQCSCELKWCWRHLLKDVRMKIGINDKLKEFEFDEGFAFESLPTLRANVQVVFELIW